MFTKLGFKFYQYKSWRSESEILKKSTLKEGYQELINELTKQNPKFSNDNFIFITFAGPPFIELPGEDYENMVDSEYIHDQEKFHASVLKMVDSLAGIYNHKMTSVIAFQRTGKKIDKLIATDKIKYKNILFVAKMAKLYHGYGNSKKIYFGGYPTSFILDSHGKIVFATAFMALPKDQKLINFLKTLPK